MSILLFGKAAPVVVVPEPEPEPPEVIFPSTAAASFAGNGDLDSAVYFQNPTISNATFPGGYMQLPTNGYWAIGAPTFSPGGTNLHSYPSYWWKVEFDVYLLAKVAAGQRIVTISHDAYGGRQVRLNVNTTNVTLRDASGTEIAAPWGSAAINTWHRVSLVFSNYPEHAGLRTMNFGSFPQRSWAGPTGYTPGIHGIRFGYDSGTAVAGASMRIRNLSITGARP